MQKLTMLLIAALIVMTTGVVTAQDYDANVGEIQVTPSTITAGESGSIYADFINLSDPNNPYEGEGTFDIRILVLYQGSEVESFEFDNEGFSLYQTRSFIRSYTFANAGFYTIQAEIYTINALLNGWPVSERLDYKTTNINIQPAMTPPTITLDEPSQYQNIMEGDWVYFSVDVHDDDGDLFQVKWYVNDIHKDDMSVSGTNDHTQKGYLFSAGGEFEVRAEAEDQEGNTSNPDAIWYVSVEAPNQPPTITTTAPNSDIVINSGDELTISWDGEDVDNDIIYVNIFYDDNDCFTDGVLGTIAFNRPQDGSFSWNTIEVPPGIYRIVATITDNNHEERRDYAEGIVTINGIPGIPILSRFLPASANVAINVGTNIEFVINTHDQDCDFRGVDWYMDGNIQDQHFDLELCDGNDNWSYTFDNEGTFYIEAQGFDFDGNYSDPIAWTITVGDPDPGSTWWTKEYDGSIDPSDASPSWTIENAFTEVQGYVDNGAYHIIDQSTSQGTGAGSWKINEVFGDEYTIEFRVKCPSSSPDGDHCSTSGVSASTRAQIFDGTRGITLDFTPTHLYVVDVSAGNDCPAEATANFETNFHNVKVIKDNGEFSVYLDGSLVTVTQGYAESRSYIIWGSLHFAGTGEGFWDYIRWNPNSASQSALCDEPSDYTQPYNSDDCTMGLWHFDEGIGTIAADASSYNHEGTLSVESWETDPAEINPGFGSAFSSYPANIESPSTTDLDFVSGSFTIECWVKADNPGGYRYIVGKRCNYPGTDNCQYSLCTNGSSVLKFFVSRQDNAYVQELLDPTFVWDNTWHHIAGVRDAENDELRLYVDGELRDSRTFSDDLYPSSDFPLMIGDHTRSTTSNHQFNGLIDEVRISNVVREFEEQNIIDTEGPIITFWNAKCDDVSDLPGLRFGVGAVDEEHGGSIVSGVEYFVDADPGLGAGIPLTPTDGAFDSDHEKMNDLTFTLREFGSGLHTIFVRACDEHGNWGPTVSETIETTWSGFCQRLHDFNFENWGVLGHCSGMAWASDWFYQTGLNIPHNNEQLEPANNTTCPLTTGQPPLYSPTKAVINTFQWGFAREAIATRLAIIAGWTANTSLYISKEYEYVENVLKQQRNAIIYLAPEGGGPGHAVLAYRTARISNSDRVIFVYDPTYPNRCGQGKVGILLTQSGDTWSLSDDNYAYSSYKFFGVSLYSMVINATTLIFASCPVDLEVTTTLGDYITRDSVSNANLQYSVTPFFGNDLDSTHIVTYFGEDYPPSAFSISVIPHDTADATDSVSLFYVRGTEVVTLFSDVMIAELDTSPYLYSTLDTGSIAGYVQADSVGLLGVPVDLYDSAGVIIASVVSDDSGYYHFPALDNGFYSVAISTPLGYQADDETQEIVVRGLPHEVNFDLTQLEIIPQQRSRGYWAHQLHKALQNKPKHYTLDDFANFANLIDVHFNNNEINPVDFYNVPQPADQNDSLRVLKKLLHMRRTGDGSPFLKRLARAQLITLMLNVVSGKVSQTNEISANGRTISQAITYCDMLVNDEIDPPDDGGPGCGSPWFRYQRASFILLKCNMGLTVPDEMIPADVVQIAYRVRNEQETLPEDFVLHQNYPNPFNPVTEISFNLPNAGDVTLEVYNIMGQKVNTLINERFEAGNHSVTWDSRDNNGHSVSSGIYFYRLTTDEFIDTKKMILLK